MAEPDLIIEAGFSDAKLAAETQKVIQKYKQMGDAAEKAFKDASGSVTDNQALRAHMRELDRLKKSYDPVYTATQKYEAAVKKLDRALQVGAIDQAKYTSEVRRAQVELGRVSGVIEQQVKPRLQGGADGFRNLGLQVQDFAVQVGAGTSVTQAFAQQFPQLASGFGAWGIALGTASAILVPLAGWLLSTGDSAEAVDKQIDALSNSTDDMIEAAESAARPIDELRIAFGSLADEIARADQAQAFFARIRAENDLLGTSRSIGRQFGSFAPVEVPRQFDGTINPDRARVAQREQINAMRELRRETGATVEQAEELRQALYRMETANSAEAVARDAANLQRVLAEIANTTGITEDQMANLSSMAANAGAARTQAERQVAAAMTEAQKIIEKYAGTTRELRELASQREAAESALSKAQKEGNAQLITDLQEVLSNIDLQIAKTKELARETDTAFQAMAKSVQSYLGGFLRDGFTSVFGSSPEQFGQDAQAATRGIRELIKSRESGGNYNATLDNGAYTGGARDLVNMTINEVLQMQRDMLNHPSNKKNSSAAGAYQIVRKTLQGLVDELGLTGNELYDPAMQDRLADQLLRRRRGQGIEGLRNEWEGLRHVNPAVIQQALGNQSIPLEDPQLASDRKRALDEENRERERKLKLVQQYGEQLSKNLVSEQQQAQLEAQRAEALARINADPSLSEGDRARAIAEVNAEMQRRLTIFALEEEAKRRGVDLDAQMVNSTLTYRDAILALGDAQKARAIADQEAQIAAQNLAERQQFAADMQQQLKDGLIDAIVAGESFADVLANVAQQLAKAALQAALFNEGPFSSGGGGGLLGGLFKGFGALLGGARAMGGPVSGGTPYLVGERGPEIIVPRSAGTVIPNHKLGGGGQMNVTIDLRGTTGDRELDMKIRAGAAQAVAQADRAMPSRVSQINQDPLRRG